MDEFKNSFLSTVSILVIFFYKFIFQMKEKKLRKVSQHEQQIRTLRIFIEGKILSLFNCE